MTNDEICRDAELESVTESARSWISHAATCLTIYANLRRIKIRIKRAFCIAGSLRLEVELPDTCPDDKDAVLRILYSVEQMARMPFTLRFFIVAERIERLRLYPIFAGAYIDPDISNDAFLHLFKFAQDLSRYDSHARCIRIMELHTSMGGHGPMLAIVDTRGGERTALQVVERVRATNEDMLADNLAGLRWRRYLST